MRVVIVGGGFAGVRTALKLANKPGFEVKLISQQSYFEYHAALYRSATGRSPLEVAIPLKDFFANDSNIEVINDEVVELNPTDKSLSGSSGSVYHYEELVLALGSVTQYFGIKGLAEHSYGVKSIQEALGLKRRLHEDLVSGSKAEQNYVVVGGGATGVELAGELTMYLTHIRKRHDIDSAFNVDLIEAAPHVLPNLPPHFTLKIEQRLRRLGITLLTDTPVKSQSVDEIKLPRGSIESHTVIWTAGVANHPFFSDHATTFQLGKGGKVTVNEFLEAHPHIYVVGDSALTGYSGMAQTALHDANFVAQDLKRKVKNQARQPYEPKKPIYAIPAGPRWSAVLWGRLKIYGYAGWVLRRLADLRLYLKFLPPRKALTAWRYGFTLEESCPKCR